MKTILILAAMFGLAVMIGLAWLILNDLKK